MQEWSGRKVQTVRQGFTEEQAASFGAAAAEYERARPEYPAAVVDWIVPAEARAAADVGAGTGKLTRALRERGLEVSAVEPSEGMRARLEAELPEVRSLAGSGERLPLPDAAVDLVTYAQAWHWVEEAPALEEAARVLRPGGRLACVWNLRDDESGWMRELSVLVELLASRSYVIVAPERERQGFFAAVRDLVATHPDLAGRESFEMPYITRCFRAGLGPG